MSHRSMTGSKEKEEGGCPPEVTPEARPWLRRLARYGYVTKGVIYSLVGFLALQAALGPGGKTTDTQGALRVIFQLTYGWMTVAVITVGLVCYALWRFIEALWDAEGKGTSAGGILKRVGYGMSGLAYGGVALTGLLMLMGFRGADDASTQRWVARLLAIPYGQWLIGALGLILAGMAINALYVAYSARFCEKLDLSRLRPAWERCVAWIGRIGIAARGVVFGLIGSFILRAALRADSDHAGGLEVALQVLARQSYGVWLLGAVAVGFIAYGLYQFSEALFRRILPAPAEGESGAACLTLDSDLPPRRS